MAQPLNETQIKRVEDAVALATASIDRTIDALQQTPSTSMWTNPLPDAARPLTEASEALRGLRERQVDIIARLGDKENELAEKERRLNERDLEQSRREGRLDQRDETLKALEEKLNKKATEIKNDRKKLQSEVSAHDTAVGRLEGAKDALKSLEAGARVVPEKRKRPAESLTPSSVKLDFQGRALRSDTVSDDGEDRPIGLSPHRRPTEGRDTGDGWLVQEAQSSSVQNSSSSSELPVTDRGSPRVVQHEPDSSLQRPSSAVEGADTGREPASGQAQAEHMVTVEDQVPGGGQPEPVAEAAGPSSQTLPAAQSGQPAGSSSQTLPAAQTDQRWSTRGMSKDLKFIWQQLEFANPSTWSDAQIGELQGWLTRFMDGNVRVRFPVVTLPACAALQSANQEVCWYRRCYNNAGIFTGVGPCRQCSEQHRPCYRITNSGVVGKKWLITQR